MVSDHLVQKGPTFPQPIDMTIDAVKGDVVVRYSDDHGQQKTESEHLDLPSDLSNGLILTLLKNVRADAAPKSLSFVAATPKPRLVKLALAVGVVSDFLLAPSPERPRITSSRLTSAVSAASLHRSWGSSRPIRTYGFSVAKRQHS